MSKHFRVFTRKCFDINNYLRENGVKGVYLVCGAGNVKGVNFYKKYGFKAYSQKFGSVTFVLDL